ncbi:MULTISPECIES: hypothetical protein [unclassified Microcoleus]|uniref:hypothetical protein n=1 Tax=unclassified Microcoleus TaxID=2642155 RepID=UPI002FD05222
MDRATVPFYPVEEFWVHQNSSTGRSPSLSLIVGPAEKTAARCGQSILDFRF